MSECRVPTGIEGFDDLIKGGFPQGSLVLLAGETGCGKTLFSARFLYSGAVEFGEKGIYVSFAEGREVFLRNMATLGMDFEKLEKEGKFKILDFLTMKEDVLSTLLEEVQRQILSLGAKRLVIDSFTSIAQALGKPIDTRIVIHAIFSKIVRQMGCTTLLIEEVPLGESRIGVSVEEFIADAVIRLDSKVEMGEMNRFLTIMKVRGTNHAKGELPFVITSEGFKVLPAYEKVSLRLLEKERMPTGILKLDQALGGGIPYGSICLIETDGTVNYKPLHTAILQRAVEKKDNLTYILSSKESWSDVETIFKKYGLDAEKLRREGRLDFIDYYERTVRMDKVEKIPETLDAEGILRILKDLFEKAHKKNRRMWLTTGIVDTITLMGIDEYFKYFAQLTSMIKRGSDVWLPYVNSGALQPEYMERIRSFADIIVKLHCKEGQHLLKVMKTPEGSSSQNYRIVFSPKLPYIQLF